MSSVLPISPRITELSSSFVIHSLALLLGTLRPATFTLSHPVCYSDKTLHYDFSLIGQEDTGGQGFDLPLSFSHL